MKPYHGPIEGERILLRLLEERDLDLIRGWRNRDDTRVWFFDPAVISPEQHRAWYDGYLTRDDDFVFIIERRNPQREPIGQASIYHIDPRLRRAELGRVIIGEPAARGMGFSTEAVRMLVGFAVPTWGLAEIFSDVIERNLPSRAMLRSSGFREEQPSSGVVRSVYRVSSRPDA
ncbi:MAG: GNAT family N-acetyltransferase [Acidobacteriota bacterium]